MTLQPIPRIEPKIPRRPAMWFAALLLYLVVAPIHLVKQDLPATIARVAGFLGTSLSPETLTLVEEKSSFAYMKGLDNKFLPLPKGTLPWGEMEMIRQGKSGNSGELITPVQQERIDAYCQA